MKRKRIVFFALLLAVFSLAACGKKAPQTGTVTAAEGFDNAGFVEVACGQSGKCTFTVNKASTDAGIEWEVYLFNKKFDDAFRYIPQANYEGYISGSAGGEMQVKKGQYLYIYSPQNGFTMDSADKVTKDAAITYSIQ